MGDRSGVGLVECTVLEALDSIGAQPRRHRRSAKVLDVVEERIGLAPGYAYESLRPPFRPLAIIEALREVIQRPPATGQDLISIVGPPCFLNGCTVTGDFVAMAAGRPTTLRLEARVTVSDDQGSVLIENIPPNANPDEVAHTLADRARMRAWATEHPGLYGRTHLPLGDLRDESSQARDTDLLVCVPARVTTAEQLREQLMAALEDAVRSQPGRS